MLDLLNLSKDDSADITMYNLANIIIETVELVQAQVSDYGVTMVTDDQLRRSEFYAEIDSRGIHRVLLNLLNNAADSVKGCHGNSGKGRIEVEIKMIDDGDCMLIRAHSKRVF